MNQKIITKLTEDIYKSAENRTKPFYKYQLYWLSHTKAPAILIEVCFVDSKADTDY